MMADELVILDYSVYGNRVDPESNRLLAAAAGAAGVRARIVGYRPGDAFPVGLRRAWLRYDLRGPADLALIVRLARALAAAGCRVFPPPPALVAAEDKLAGARAFARHRVPVPETSPGGDVSLVGTAEGYILFKPRVAWGGRGKRFLRAGEAAAFAAGPEAKAFVRQRFIPHTLSWVVAAAGGKPYAVLEEDRCYGAAVPAGGGGEESEGVSRLPRPGRLPDRALALAPAALAACGLAAGTVDLLSEGDRFLVLEVNSAPRLFYPELPGLDLAGPMFQAVRRLMEACE